MIRTVASKVASAMLAPFGLRLQRISTVQRGYTGPRPPPIQMLHTQDCGVLPSRADLLRWLPSGGIVAEIGVDQGKFSDSILRLNNPEKLHLVDAWASAKYSAGHSQVADRFSREVDDGTVIIDRGMSTDVLLKFPDGYFDWVYIDTDHTFETTLAELNICARKVKQGGYIAGHDFARWSKTGDQFGVIQACHQFCNEQNWRFAVLTVEYDNQPSYCLKRFTTGPASRDDTAQRPQLVGSGRLGTE